MTQNSLSKADVLERAEQLDFPSSVVDFFQGYLGQPVGGFPEPLRTKVIRNKPRIDGRPGAGLEPLDFKKIKAELRSKFGKHISDADVTSYVMYPKVRGLVSRVGRASDYAVHRSSKSTKGFCRNMATSGKTHECHSAEFCG
jgi:pyruvate carboxylase